MAQVTSDYINFDTALITGQRLLRDDKTKVMGLYIITSINLGLRVSDVLQLTFEQLRSDKIDLTEKKTDKRRVLAVNHYIHEAVAKFEGATGLAFKSQKGTVYLSSSINDKLKQVFAKESKKIQVSSHSLRKSFGRRVWENDRGSERALTYLSELFNHTSTAVTRRYLGIRQEELNDIYLNL